MQRLTLHARAITLGVALAAVLATLLATTPASANANDHGRSAAEYWTAERMERAVPRDLVLDQRGHAYLQRPDGALEPYGRRVTAGRQPLRAVPSAKPENPGNGGGNDGGGDGGGGTDQTGPDISDLEPNGTEIGGTATFSATVTDESGIKSVTFRLDYRGTTQSFSASPAGDDSYAVTLQGFEDHTSGSWRVVAKDGARKGGNTVTSDAATFTVDTGGDGGGSTDPDVVPNAEWLGGGDVQTAAGRIYFEMPDKGPHWSGYVCSGTAVTDSAGDRSVILTAAHCVYDDVNKVFARNVIFIPDQSGTSGSGTDTDCSNDPLGCWAPSFGVVDQEWAAAEFPDNIPWDYAYYVVPDDGSRSGSSAGGALDEVAGSLPVSFTTPSTDAFTRALGYSYSDDPNFMYCAEDMAMEGPDNWWLASCGLSGGSSGGPWIQSDTPGSGPVTSVNSWGYTDQPGMAGPRLDTSSASCLFQAAETGSENAGTPRGLVPESC